MERFCDLHLHTTASDGIYSPSKLIDHAIAHGVSALAVTDHDTTDGLDEAIACAEEKGVSLVPGIEFSVEYPEGSFHLLGFYIDHGDPDLQRLIGTLKERRGTRIYRMIDDLASHGIDIPINEVLSISGGSPGRPHVARVLVNHGHAPSVKEAFKNFLVKGKPGYVKKDKATFDDAVGCIIGAGGIPVLAHPISLECCDMGHFERLLEGLLRKGLRGIEVYASMHSEDEISAFLRIARGRGLLATGGSDFHGDKNEKIGWYSDGFPIPYGTYEELAAYRRAHPPGQ
jgi:3',5'-nucleoside bisphosphate phosphatase